MSPSPETTPPSHPARDVLREMWTTRRHEAVADLDALVSLLSSLAASPSDADLRSHSQRLAHQLVGVFGVFGFTDLKNEMARVDIELSDPSMLIDDLLARVQAITDTLP